MAELWYVQLYVFEAPILLEFCLNEAYNCHRSSISMSSLLAFILWAEDCVSHACAKLTFDPGLNYSVYKKITPDWNEPIVGICMHNYAECIIIKVFKLRSHVQFWPFKFKFQQKLDFNKGWFFLSTPCRCAKFGWVHNHIFAARWIYFLGDCGSKRNPQTSC